MKRIVTPVCLTAICIIDLILGTKGNLVIPLWGMYGIYKIITS